MKNNSIISLTIFYGSKIALLLILIIASGCQSTNNKNHPDSAIQSSPSNELKLKVETEVRSVLGTQEEVQIDDMVVAKSEIGGTLVCGYVSRGKIEQDGIPSKPFVIGFDPAGNVNLGEVAQKNDTGLSVIQFCEENNLKLPKP